MSKGIAKVGGATPRTYKLNKQTIAILPTVGKGNATAGIESLVRSLPSLLEAYRELSRGNGRQRAIAARMDAQLRMSEWDEQMKEIEILDEAGEVIGWVI